MWSAARSGDGRWAAVRRSGEGGGGGGGFRAFVFMAEWVSFIHWWCTRVRDPRHLATPLLPLSFYPMSSLPLPITKKLIPRFVYIRCNRWAGYTYIGTRLTRGYEPKPKQWREEGEGRSPIMVYWRKIFAIYWMVEDWMEIPMRSWVLFVKWNFFLGTYFRWMVIRVSWSPCAGFCKTISCSSASSSRKSLAVGNI